MRSWYGLCQWRLKDILHCAQTFVIDLGVILSRVSRLTETDRNGPKRTFVDTETDLLGTETAFCGYRNGPTRTFVDTETDFLGTETDFSGYQNGLFGY